jgi:hypothetical protein
MCSSMSWRSFARARPTPRESSTIVVKDCKCGRTFTAESWTELKSLGTIDNGRHTGELLDLRLCLCGTTLTLPIGEHAPSIEFPIEPKPDD